MGGERDGDDDDDDDDDAANNDDLRQQNLLMSLWHYKPSVYIYHKSGVLLVTDIKLRLGMDR